MALDRYSIERTDFAVSRRGYDPDEVDRHLREFSQAFGEIQRERQPSSTPVAGAAVEQVQAIVEAAERSAAEILELAKRDARQITEEAETHAVEVRERSEGEAGGHVQGVEEATTKMLQRADRLETEVDRIVETLRAAAGFMVENIRGASGSLVEDLRGGGTTLRSELEAIRRGLSDVREARPRAQARVDRDYPIEPTTTAASVFNGGEEFAAEDPPEYEGTPSSPAGGVVDDENARVIALNMALDGRPRDETARYLSDNFELSDQESLLDDVYSRAASR